MAKIIENIASGQLTKTQLEQKAVEESQTALSNYEDVSNIVCKSEVNDGHYFDKLLREDR